jgi:hypothetical protein
VNVLGVMPVKGRAEKSVRCITRLLSTADAPLHIAVVTDDDPEAAETIAAQLGGWQGCVSLIELPERGGYWHACSVGANSQPEFSHVLNLANDLLPGRQWLGRAIEAYLDTFGTEPAVLGLNDGVHPGTHAGHFIADRRILAAWYGEDLYPHKYYMHLYADNEIVERAHALNRFAIAPFSVLFHDHPVSGGDHDEVYALGHQSLKPDYKAYVRRKPQWKH